MRGEGAVNLCERCRSELGGQTGLPLFSMGGGAAGLLGAAVTGVPILVPLGLIAGVFIDAETCSRCGEAAGEDNPLYRPMQSGEDDVGRAFFAPHRSPDRADASQMRPSGPPSRPLGIEDPLGSADDDGLFRSPAPEEAVPSPGPPDEDAADAGPGERYAWDESACKLVPMDPDEGGVFTDPDALEDFDPLPSFHEPPTPTEAEIDSFIQGWDIDNEGEALE